MADACSADLVCILARVANAEEVALSEFYDLTSSLVFRVVLRILYNPAVAEEVTLDVYMQVWRQAKLYDAQRAAPRTWLLMIARSRAIDSLRSSRCDVTIAPVDCDTLVANSPGADEALSAKEWEETIRSAMQCLTPNQREAIEMAFYGGMTYAAIASELGKPLGTVKSHIRLGMERLRGYLETHCRPIGLLSLRHGPVTNRTLCQRVETKRATPHGSSRCKRRGKDGHVFANRSTTFSSSEL